MHDSGLSGGCIDSVVEGLQSFVSLYQQHISGDEKSEVQTFLDRFGYQLKAGQLVQQGFGLPVYEVGATAILARQSVF
jgi:hypothetical protein